jgi:hypothetical protein
MDRTVVSFGTAEAHDKRERKYLNSAGYEEKLKTITYLRECFYGTKATTGRLQRIYRFLNRKNENPQMLLREKSGSKTKQHGKAGSKTRPKSL